MVGATVHECTKDIDGGKIFGTTRAELSPDDDVFSVFARSVIAGADLYLRIVRELLAGRLTGVQQESFARQGIPCNDEERASGAKGSRCDQGRDNPPLR